MTNDTIGVDISKDHLDAHRMSDGASRRFANDSAGHTAFVKWLDDAGLRVVYEPTGPYHRAFERRLTDWLSMTLADGLSSKAPQLRERTWPI